MANRQLTATASVAGVATAASFSLTNLAGTPASVTATAGTPQSATVNTAFGTALQAVVKDGGNNLLSGVSVNVHRAGLRSQGHVWRIGECDGDHQFQWDRDRAGVDG